MYSKSLSLKSMPDSLNYIADQIKKPELSDSYILKYLYVKYSLESLKKFKKQNQNSSKLKVPDCFEVIPFLLHLFKVKLVYKVNT